MGMEMETTNALASRVEEATALVSTNKAAAVKQFQDIIAVEAYETDDVKAKEEAITQLCDLYAALGKPDDLQVGSCECLDSLLCRVLELEGLL